MKLWFFSLCRGVACQEVFKGKGCVRGPCTHELSLGDEIYTGDGVCAGWGWMWSLATWRVAALSSPIPRRNGVLKEKRKKN